MLKECRHELRVEHAYTRADIDARVGQMLASMCTRKDGFYTKIHDLRYEECFASTMGYIRVIVVATCETFLPIEGEVGVAQVTDCLGKFGLYCLYRDKLKILVPLVALENYSFAEGEFRHVLGERVIRKGDCVRIRIERVRYQVGQYRAVGILEE